MHVCVVRMIMRTVAPVLAVFCQQSYCEKNLYFPTIASLIKISAYILVQFFLEIRDSYYCFVVCVRVVWLTLPTINEKTLVLKVSKN